MNRALVLAIALALPMVANADDGSAPLTGRAYTLSNEAFAQVAAGDLSAAEHSLRAALAVAPEHPQLQAQLADVLERQQRFDEAIAVLDALIARAPDHAIAYLQRAYLAYRNGRYAAAAADFGSALARGLDAQRQRSAQLGWADAALASGSHADALQALSGVTPSDHAVEARRAMAHAGLQEWDAAIAAWRAAEAASQTPQERTAAIRSRAQLLRDLGRDAEASDAILDGVARYPDNRALMLDAAYLALAVGDDASALTRFSAGAEDPDAPPNALVDAAYTANRLARSDDAARFFRLSIDRHYDDPTTRAQFTEQQWYGMRRQIQEIERRTGFQAALFHRGNAFVPGVAGDDVLQASIEGFWQPEGIGYRGGRILQFFLRGVQTLDAPGLRSPAETRLGSIGARYKPFGSLSLVLTAEHVFGLGDQTDDDWLLRAGYSYDRGVDLQPWNDSWTTVNGYVEAVRFIKAKRDVVGAQLRVGRSFAFGDESWVVLPHVGLALDYDSAEARRFAGGIGPGVAVRFWHRGDRYWAPPSYVELQVQYRYDFGDDDRNRGVAAQLVWYY